ncbi:MAG TPA: hypothetical protein OIM59_07550 [Bacteroides mediterraneensis]|jgi:hypothetical protein|uniref:hypothetical protein n=1 Tax=Bacteroides mediterraneensis TaxID=1841856 RepID=UPI0026F15C77|nr:hypothetical protein [Bacteroides mediterraneensis]HJH64473.1 hypothetical protein [Bacteroides mediterraneensis]
MTTTEKLYTAGLALFFIDFTKPAGLSCINNELIKLGIRDVKDAMSAIQNSTKEEIYRVLRNMNREDKKTAQQHLLNSYLNGGKMNDPQMAFILNEILTECGMIDKQI